jgi:hypothetical protein
MIYFRVAGRLGPAAADDRDSFVPSYLRTFVNRRCVKRDSEWRSEETCADIIAARCPPRSFE